MTKVFLDATIAFVEDETEGEVKSFLERIFDPEESHRSVMEEEAKPLEKTRT